MSSMKKANFDWNQVELSLQAVMDAAVFRGVEPVNSPYTQRKLNNLGKKKKKEKRHRLGSSGGHN